MAALEGEAGDFEMAGRRTGPLIQIKPSIKTTKTVRRDNEHRNIPLIYNRIDSPYIEISEAQYLSKLLYMIKVALLNSDNSLHLVNFSLHWASWNP